MILLTNIAQLLTMSGGARPRRGRELGELGLVKDAAVLINGGQIVAAGPQRAMLKHEWFRKHRKQLREIDCAGKTVLPGFVDSHTHPVFAEPRLVDFEKRTQGASYQQIAAAGGGIRSSVNAVRKASSHQLTQAVTRALRRMQSHGTTTVEAKSGYGLSVESELRSLHAIRDAAQQWPGTVVPTLLGAHVVPDEFRSKPALYVKEVCDKMMPRAAQEKLAEYVDVFCERGAFSLAAALQIFAAAHRNGLKCRAHVGQFTSCSLGGLLAFQPSSFDHMDHVLAADVRRLAKSDTVSTLLPGANYFLGHTKYPDARKLIAAGLPVALATDFNPGTAPSSSMPFVLSLACTHMKMTVPEAMVASTINGAHALDLAVRKGSIEPGKDADLAIFNVSDHREIAYWFGTNLCEATVVAGNYFTS